MPFSLYSYLLGVGTVVGALAFGFGGGVLLTNTAMKENPAGPTRMERVARAEPAPAATQQVASAPENAAPPAAQTPAVNTGQAPAAQSPAVNADQPPAAQPPVAQTPAATQPVATPTAGTEPTKPNPQREAERAKEPGPVQPAEQVRQPAEQAKQTEPREDEQRKTSERKAERSKRYAERKPRDATSDTTVARMRPRRLEVVEEPEQVVPAPQEQHFDLFRMPGLFGRPDVGNE
jgi:hypothetical protein